MAVHRDLVGVVRSRPQPWSDDRFALPGIAALAGIGRSASTSFRECFRHCPGTNDAGIPGVTVFFSREGAPPRTTVTGYGGEFNFSQLDPGPV